MRLLVAFVLRLVIYFINNKMLSATGRGGGEQAACWAGYGLLCARQAGRDVLHGAAWGMQHVRWAYCAKNKINCVHTHNRAMNQNHTSWLYIDIRLSRLTNPIEVPLAVATTCGLHAMQIQNGSKPVLSGHAPFRRSPATHNWKIAATINRTMQIEG